MQIGIDYRSVVAATISGIGVYTQQLVQHLAASYPQDTYHLFVDHPVASVASLPNVVVQPVAARNRILWEQIALPRAANRLGLDLLHRPNDVGGTLIPLRMPYVVTVHDLIPLLMKDVYLRGRAHRSYYYLKLIQTRLQAAHVLTVSRCSKLALIQHLGLSAARVSVTYHGLSSIEEPTSTIPAGRSLRDLGLDSGQYVLGIGGSEYRKNNLVLIEAFARLPQTDWPALRLAIVGGKWRGSTALHEYVARHGLEDRVKLLDNISDAELHQLYRQAAVFVFPSCYEGFGIPVLEAMAHGVPTITTNQSALPEIAGDAALLVDPTDSMALTEQMTRVLSDRQLRAQLIERGYANLTRFSAGIMAERTHAVYAAVMGRTRRQIVSA